MCAAPACDQTTSGVAIRIVASTIIPTTIIDIKCNLVIGITIMTIFWLIINIITNHITIKLEQRRLS